MFGYVFPLLGIFWSMLFFFLWITWLMLLFRIIGDIFRSEDMGGFAKALWILLVIVAPFLGVLVYVIARGDSMTRRQVEAARAQRQQFDNYVREAAGGTSAADELAKLAELKAQGVLTDAEFATQKAKLLA